MRAEDETATRAKEVSNEAQNLRGMSASWSTQQILAAVILVLAILGLVSETLLSIVIHPTFKQEDAVLSEVADRSSSQLEVQLAKSALRNEGIGAVASGLKPVLLLANATGAVITARDIMSDHKYHLNEYFRFRPISKRPRVVCRASRNISRILWDIVRQCEQYPYDSLPSLFKECNTIVVSTYLAHPRQCVRHTARLMRAFIKFPFPDSPKRDVCVLRRGGDVERKIATGKYNVWALDARRLMPLLDVVKKRGARLVVVTQTYKERELRNQFRPHVFSNNESLEKVVRRLSKCRCLFTSSGSSFAVTMVQLSQPAHVVYTESHDRFKFSVEPYRYEEWGERAHSMLEDFSKLADICAPSARTIRQR